MRTLLAVGFAGLILGSSSIFAVEKKADNESDMQSAVEKGVTQGALRIVGEDGTVVECPLEHTDVKADISGFIARVKVTQSFRNPTKEKIEAVYVFPLPHEAAVDDMTMVIGERRIVGMIKRRADARQIYQQAIASGQAAALLEQERPNIFTQSVGNIEPGQKVDIEISYVDVLKYDMGTYEFHYPMVVGPRYNPQKSPGQPVVADAGKINPPVLKPTERTGHDLSLTINLDAGVPIQNLKNSNHKVHTINKGESEARVRLLQEDSIPNKDFVLRYDVVGKKPEMAVLAHTGEYSGDARRVGKGYFMLMIQPKEDEKLKKQPPREIVFLVDVSGSMRNAPTAKTREAMEQMLKLCRPIDTVQVITFAGRATQLFEKPVPVNEASIKKAVGYTRGLKGGGGTEMLKGIKLAIDQPVDKERVRIVVMLTDGYIGNESQIIKHVGENCGDQIRFWAIGIGQSPNMFLIDGVAKQGHGMGKKLGLKDDAKPLTTEVMTRIQRAQLANLKIDWGNLEVSQTYPAKLPELWAGRPVIVYGRYKDGGESEIAVSGTVEGEATSWPLNVKLPTDETNNDVLAKTWARQKIEYLMHQSFYEGSPAVEEEVTAIALNYRLMSQYTSFVAVDPESMQNLEEPPRPPRRMAVPVPLPEGTEWEGFFGRGDALRLKELGDVPMLGLLPAKKSRVLEKQAAAALASPLSAAPALSPVASRISNYELAFRMPSQYQKVTSDYYSRLSRSSVKYQSNRASKSLRRAPAVVSGLNGFGTSGGGWAYVPNQNGRDRAAGLRGIDARYLFEDEPVGESLGIANPNLTWNAIAQLISTHKKEADAEFGSAEEHFKKNEFVEAHAAYARALLLDSSAASIGAGDSEIANRSIAKLEEIRANNVIAWTNLQPALDKRLDLIVRDKSIDAALQQVAKVAGIKVTVTPGAIDDAESALVNSVAHVTYLDLRRAKVSQALDWITGPVRLTWSLDDESVVVSSDRRSAKAASWIYDVAAITIPNANELQEIKDYNKAAKLVKEQLEQFVSAVQKASKLDKNSVKWFAPGQLLVTANRQGHERVATILENLANPKYKASDELADVFKRTVARAKLRKESLTKLRVARNRMRTAAAHDKFAFQLLAAAADGRLDLEALTELQFAWKNKATKELLGGKSAGVVLRSLWMICEASQTLLKEEELKTLSNNAYQMWTEVAPKALEELAKKPDDHALLSQVFFASLAAQSRGDVSLVKRALPLLSKSNVQVLANSLLAEPEGSSTALVEHLRGGVGGEDNVLLTALACRRVGGEAWETFRAKSREIVGEQPLRGEIVVLVNRLASPQLVIATPPSN